MNEKFIQNLDKLPADIRREFALLANRYGEKKKENTPMYTEEDEQRMDIIGQNGNDGLHYEDESEEIEEEPTKKQPTFVQSYGKHKRI